MRLHKIVIPFFIAFFLLITLSSFSLHAEGELTKGKLTLPCETCQSEPSKGKPILPGETCQTEPLDRWTPQEKWVWKQVCEGKIANFNGSDAYGGELDPRRPKENIEEWTKEWSKRILTSEFLETILLHEPYRGALTHHGVRIMGAWFREPLNLSNAILDHQLGLEASRFDKDIDFTGLKTDYLISLTGSKFTGALNMYLMDVGGSLFMRDGSKFEEVNLIGTKLRGAIEIRDSKFTGILNMNAIEVGSYLTMNYGSEFKDVVLSYTKIGGGIEMNDSKFTDILDMRSIEMGSDLYMCRGSELKDVILVNAKIGGFINLSGSTFDSIDLTETNIDKEIQLVTRYYGDVKWSSSLITVGNIYNWDDLLFEIQGDTKNLTTKLLTSKLEEADQLEKIKTIDVDQLTDELKEYIVAAFNAIKDNLTFYKDEVVGNDIILSSEVQEELNNLKEILEESGELKKEEYNLSDSQKEDIKWFNIAILKKLFPQVLSKWKNKPSMILRNTKIGTLQDSKESWPENLELEGFVYDRLGKFYTDEGKDTATRDITWLKDWLNKQKEYKPQPYEHLASVLRKSGHVSMANSILYAGRERKRTETATGLNWFGLTILKYVIGYGYGYYIFYSLIWIILFIVTGMLCVWWNKEGSKRGILWSLFYSLDIMLPIIRLDESHYDDIKLNGFAKYYFYFQTLIGFVLASFLAAGISGLTK